MNVTNYICACNRVRTLLLGNSETVLCTRFESLCLHPAAARGGAPARRGTGGGRGMVSTPSSLSIIRMVMNTDKKGVLEETMHKVAREAGWHWFFNEEQAGPRVVERQ